MSVFATGNMSLYASNEEEEDFICSAPLLWDQFPTRKALLITLDAVCSKLGAPGTMLVCKMLNRLWEVSSCVPAGVAHVKSLIDHARVKSNEGGPGNEAFLNMVADISLPETKRSSYFKSWFYEDQKGTRTLCINEQGDVETKGFVDSDQHIEMWRVEKFVAAYHEFKNEELREKARNVERERQLQLVREEKLKLMASATASTSRPFINPSASSFSSVPSARQNLIDIVLLSDPGPNRRINAKDLLMCKPADAFKVYRDSKFKFVDEAEAGREILHGRRTAKVIAQKLKLPQDMSFFKVMQGKPQILPAPNRALGPTPAAVSVGPLPHQQIKPLVAIAPKPAPLALPAPTIVAVTGGAYVPTAVAHPSQSPMIVRAVVPGAGMSVLRASLNAPASGRMSYPAAATSQKYVRQQHHLIDFKTMYYDIQKKYFSSLESISALTKENKSLKIESEPERVKSLLRANFVQGSHIGQARSRLDNVVSILKQIENDLDDDSKKASIKSHLSKAIESAGEAVASLDTHGIKVSLKRKQEEDVSYGKDEGTDNSVGSQLAKKLRPDPCVSQTMGYVRAFLVEADQVRLAALETARALYRRQNLVEDKESLDGLFQCHMVSWKMRHRFLPAAAAERSNHRDSYLSAMTEQVIGMIESQMNAKTFNYHGGVNVWRNYKSVCKTIDNTLNKLVQAEMRASGAGEHDALADEVDPSVFGGRVPTLPIGGDVSMQDLQNAKEKFLSFTRKLNDIVVSFTADGKMLTSHDMRRVAHLVEVNCYETYSLLKKSGIMANDYALQRARAWANKTDCAFVAASDRKFFEKFSEAVVELSKDFNFVTGAGSDPLEAGIELDHEGVKEGIQKNGSGHDESSRKEDSDEKGGHEFNEAGGRGCDESANAYDSTTDYANDNPTEPAGDDDDDDDDEYDEYDDDYTPIECEQVMEEGVDPLDEGNNGVADENDKDTGDVVMLE